MAKMAKPYGGGNKGSVGQKRGRASEGCDPSSNQSKKNHRKNRKVARSPSPSSSGNSSEKFYDCVSEEETEVRREPTMYDNLLTALGSGGREGRSDTEEDESEDEDGQSPSNSLSEGEDEDEDEEEDEDGDEDEEGSDEEFGLSHEQSEETKNNNETAETDQEDDLDEALETDQDDDLDSKCQGSADASKGTSSFNSHLDHSLSEGEVDNLTKVRWEFKWEVPADDNSMSKWKGTGICFLEEDEDISESSDHGLKLKLYKHWLDIYKSAGGNDFNSSKQRRFFSLCNSYRDILHSDKKPFYLKGLEEDSSVMDAYIIHALNHVYKSRDLIAKNDAKLSKHSEHSREEVLNAEGFLDHGFTRPKVLILLPLRSIALRVVKRLIQLTPLSQKNVAYKDRFFDEFGTGEELSSDGEHLKSQKSSKPSDFQALFGANNDDHFMIGIKFTKGSIKLYSDFYSSDMIVASPLALITKIGEAEVDKEKDVDFLSSIEVLIIDHSDVISMQNWSHVSTVVEKLNHIPSKQHGTDVMRIRRWYLDGHAKFYRQTIMLGSYLTPEMNQVFNKLCLNYQGKVKLASTYKGVLPKVLLPVRQVYERIDATAIVGATDYDARFDYFVNKMFPKIMDSLQGGIMLFISSYFELVRIRNFLKSQDASFCMIHDYTKQSDISRARNWFIDGKRKILLYTERAHFYHRYKIRGIKNLIVYSLPERKEFYPEVLNMLDDAENMACTVIFSMLDKLRLERIVGSKPARKMLSSEKGIFVFA